MSRNRHWNESFMIQIGKPFARFSLALVEGFDRFYKIVSFQALQQPKGGIEFTDWTSETNPFLQQRQAKGKGVATAVSVTEASVVSEDEMVVLGHLAQAWNTFLTLEVMHPQHQQEFMHAIHEAQRMVLSRAGLRDLARRDDSE